MSYPKLNPEFKVRWLAALRSGEYKQGKDYLRKNDSFCCLGVACNLIDPNNWVAPPQSITTGVLAYGAPSCYSVPTNDADINVMFEDGKYYSYDNECDADYDAFDFLASMNDAGEDDFNSIADWIEKNL